MKKLLNGAKNRRQKRFLIFFLAKLGISTKTPSEKITLARHIVLNMTGNANFTTPNPTLAALTAAADALEAAEAALDGSHAKVNTRNIAEAALDEVLTQMQGYVESIAGKDTSIILSAGMQVRDPRTAATKLGPVTDITIKIGQFRGTIDMKWKGFKRGKLYVIEAREMNTANDWTIVGETTKSKITIDELASGTTYEFRIACVSSAGVGPFTDPFSIDVY